MGEAEALVKSAREEGEAKIAKAKVEASAKSEAKLLAKKSKLNDELKSAVKESESEGIAVEKDIEQQAEDLSEYIIKKVLPSDYVKFKATARPHRPIRL